MKKIILPLILMAIPFFGMSQAYTNTMMGAGGIFGDGYGGEITYNSNLSERSFAQIALDVTLQNFNSGETTIPYSSYTLSYSYFTTLYSTGRRMQVLSIGGGVLAGYELVNNGNRDLSNIVSLNGDSKFIYGGVATAEIDVIISEHFSLVLKTAQFYHLNSDFGKLTNFSGLGVRYYFNK